MKVKMLIAVITLVFTVSIVSVQTDKTPKNAKKNVFARTNKSNLLYFSIQKVVSHQAIFQE